MSIDFKSLFRNKKKNIFKLEPQDPELIPYACHYDHQTILTKNGELMQSFKISGFSSLNSNLEADLRTYIRKAIKENIDSNKYSIWIHTVRRKVNLAPPSHYQSKIADLIHSEWCDKNRWNDKLVNELYITILHSKIDLDIKSLSPTDHLRTYKSQEQHFRYLSESCKKLTNMVDKILESLSVFGAKKLTIKKDNQGPKSELVEFLYKIINLHEERMETPIKDLSDFLASGKTAFGNNCFEVYNNRHKYFGAILSIKDHQNFSENELDRLIRLPQEFIYTESITFCDTKVAEKNFSEQIKYLQIGGNENLFPNSELSIINDLLQKQSSIDFVEKQLSIMLIGDSINHLNSCVFLATQELNNLGIVAVREDLNMENIYWSQLPGNFNFIKRKQITYSDKISEFASLHNSPKGDFESVWGPPITIFKSFKNTPYFFHFHKDQTGHTLICGPDKSDAPLLLNFLLSESSKLMPNVMGIESKTSSKILIESLDGDYIYITPEEYSFLNPLQLDDTSENRFFLKYWLKQITRIDIDDKELDNIINALYQLPNTERNLGNAEGFIKNESIIESLSIWRKDGKFAKIFDNKEDKLSSAKTTICFNISKIVNNSENTNIYAPLLSYLTYFFERSIDQHNSIFYVNDDENLFKTDIFVDGYKNWLNSLTLRKSIFILNTKHNIKSIFFENNSESFATKILFPDNENYLLYKDITILNQNDLDKIKSMKTLFRQFMIIQQNEKLVAEFNIDGLHNFFAIFECSEKNLDLQEQAKNLAAENENKWYINYLDLFENHILDEEIKAI